MDTKKIKSLVAVILGGVVILYVCGGIYNYLMNMEGVELPYECDGTHAESYNVEFTHNQINSTEYNYQSQITIKADWGDVPLCCTWSTSIILYVVGGNCSINDSTYTNCVSGCCLFTSKYACEDNVVVVEGNWSLKVEENYFIGYRLCSSLNLCGDRCVKGLTEGGSNKIK